MRPTASLAQLARLTLFTRQNCSLCETAKSVLQSVRQSRAFAYNQVEIMIPGQEKWKAMYEFDVPVVHIQPEGDPTDLKEVQTERLRKLMHRFSEKEVEAAMDELGLD